MDKIKIDNLMVFGNHGVYSEENALGQKFYVSVTLYTDTRIAGKKDKLSASINYGEVCQIIEDCVKNNTFKLIERVGETIAQRLLLNIERLRKVDVEVHKPWAPIGIPVDNVSVCITREWHTAYISFGSNLGDKEKYIKDAINELESREDSVVERVSSFYKTVPYGNVAQKDFVNGCLKLVTLLQPRELLDVLNDIEKNAGRTREVHWGPRTLDLDIIFYDDLIIEEEDFCVPHVDMHNRKFVLEPLHEIAPYKHHPCSKKTVRQMLQELE